MYVTPAQLIDGPDRLTELSELLHVAAELLRAAIGGNDTDAWPPEEVAAAEDAVATVQRAIVHADGEIEARLAVRGYVLPMDPEKFPILATWGRAIARYHLHPQRDRTDEDRGRIERDYRDTLRALDLVAAGKLSLGADDPLLEGEDGAVRMTSRDRIFTRGTLGAL